MGVWGPENFQNDDVMDWLTELAQANDTELLVATLRDVTDSDPNWIEAPECCRAIGAAEIVAALRDAPHPALPAEAEAWAVAHRALLQPTLLSAALAALSRIRGNSELRALWTSNRQLDSWLAALDDLARRLEP